MVRGKPWIWRACLAVIIAFFGLSVIMPGTAMASDTYGLGLPNQSAANDGQSGHYHITASNYGFVGHTCTSLGTYKTTTADMCADIYAQAVPGTKQVNIWEGVEGYCQGGGYPQCWYVTANAPYMVDGNTVYSIRDGCGYLYSFACDSNDRNYFYYDYTTLGADGDCHNFRTYLNPNNQADSVGLPGDVEKDLTTTLDTGSIYICDEM